MLIFFTVFLSILLFICGDFFLNALFAESFFKVFLVYTFYYCSVLCLSYPAMLFVAFFTGFLWDIINLPVFIEVNELGEEIFLSSHQADMAFGYTIFLFAFIGSIVHGMSPFFNKGKILLPFIACCIGLLLHFFAEYFLTLFIGLDATQEYKKIFNLNILLNLLIIIPMFYLVKFYFNRFTNIINIHRY